MKMIKTNELEAGMWVAQVHDLPNCGGIQVVERSQGEVVSVEYCDMWGTPSETHTTVVVRPKGAKEWDTLMRTVHNSHNWLVRA